MKKPSGYIEEALLRLLKENNMDRISVSMVCEECNVSRQTLYYHYDFGDSWKIWIAASRNCPNLITDERITQSELDRAN